MVNELATGIALVLVAIGGLVTAITASIVSIVGLYRANTKIDSLNTKIDGMLVERDKAKVIEGEQKERIVGDERAATLAQGQREGRAEAAIIASGAVPNGQPLPVADDRTAAAAERSAAATERVASATEDKRD